MTRGILLERRGFPAQFDRTGSVLPPPPSGGGARDFFSDWRTATLGAAGRSDNGKWNIVGGSGQEVIESTGLDFPCANVCRITALQATTGYAFLRRTGLAIPAVGASRYYRGYIRISSDIQVAVADPETHPHQDGNAASQSNWLLHVYHNSGGANTWRPQIRPAAAVNAYPYQRWELANTLLKDTTYRWEKRIERTATGLKFDVRWYSSLDALIYSSANYFDSEQSTNLAAYMVSNEFAALDITALDGFNAGLNGLAGTDYFPSRIWGYQGALATGTEDWIGPYSEELG